MIFGSGKNHVNLEVEIFTENFILVESESRFICRDLSLEFSRVKIHQLQISNFSGSKLIK